MWTWMNIIYNNAAIVHGFHCEGLNWKCKLRNVEKGAQKKNRIDAHTTTYTYLFDKKGNVATVKKKPTNFLTIKLCMIINYDEKSLDITDKPIHIHTHDPILFEMLYSLYCTPSYDI